MRDWRVYVKHMLESIERIKRYVAGLSRQEFMEDDMVRDAVIRNIEIIGEAARNIPEEFASAHRDIPWRAMADMRNRVIHGYFSIDWDIVWEVIVSDIPDLEKRLRRLYDEHGNGE